MTDELKAGDRVKMTFEGVVTDRYGKTVSLSKGDSIAIETDGALEIFIETEGYLYDLGIEIVKPPLQPGLYYDTSDDPTVGQISLVYKYEDGQWYDFQLDEITLPDGAAERLVRLGAVS